MTTPDRDKTANPHHGGDEKSGKPPAAHGPEAPHGRSLSMHDGIPDWYDCCSCEAEPYWEEAMKAQPETEERAGEKG